MRVMNGQRLFNLPEGQPYSYYYPSLDAEKLYEAKVVATRNRGLEIILYSKKLYI